MTIPMEKTSDNPSSEPSGNPLRERIQRLYNQNAELESRRRKAAQARIPSDPNAWQQMRENYEIIILEDHAFAEQHEVEYALWQLHYRRIEELRAHYSAALLTVSQSGKGTLRGGPERVTKIRSQLKTFLSEATGFYHDLMVKIRAKYGLPLGYFTDDPESHISLSKEGNRSVEFKKGLVSCNRCLIYLGDLARYKGLYGEGDSKDRDFAAACSYYMQAASIWPSSGNPHHQLAILASYSGDDLVAVYRYFRSLAVDNPFSTARENLIIAFEKNRQSYSQLLGDLKTSSVKTKQVRNTGRGRGKGDNKPTTKDVKVEVTLTKEKSRSMAEILKSFCTRVVRLNGILFTRTSLETFDEVFSLTKSDFLELISSGPVEALNFGSDTSGCRLLIIRLIVILIFTVHNVNRETENQSYAVILQRSVVLQNAFTAIFEFMGHILERCILLTDPSVSYMLPGIMVFVEWLACRQDIAVGSEPDARQSSARSFFWKQCVTFLNKLLLSGCMFVNQDEDETCFYNMSSYDEGETGNRLALPEDFELRGFLPLQAAQLVLDFSRKHSFDSEGGKKETKARIERIIAAGKSLANVVKVGQQVMYYDTKLKSFVIGFEPETAEIPTSDLIDQAGSVGSKTTALQPKAQLHLDGDDEDEVIVFKPVVAKNNTDLIGSNLTVSEVFLPGVDVLNVNLENTAASVSASHNNTILQYSFNSRSRPPTSLVDVTAQYLQPAQPSDLNWASERGSAFNGFSSLSFLESDLSSKSELQDSSALLLPAPSTVPFPQSLSLGAVNRYPVLATETVVPTQYDSVMSLGANADTVSRKSSYAMSVGVKKNPVSRPIRHSGPPPGFKSVPSNPVDELFSGIPSKEVPTIDDYSWLDGYRGPSSTKVGGFSNSINPVQAGLPVTKSDNSIGLVSFPFPGKQVSTSRAQIDKQNIWQDYQLCGNLNQNHQKANHQSVSLAQQYQGQSLWEGRFFV
ncbi:DNA/RNA-binding domain [Heracleum sosnowskyi]|uniref:DNA/RNA-binding domain n=1 Tax=Heracleum sosnowskyi TaxID=360622 RepID=A0AAD8IJZ8_9APIA|nr:DNA/RNA-binding domain [Heracleum sosnowskyi]